MIFLGDGKISEGEIREGYIIAARLSLVNEKEIGISFSVIFQTYVIESYFVQERLQCWIEDIFSTSKYQYEILEEEMVRDQPWPPVSSAETLAQAFERMDSQQVRDFDQSSLLSSLMDSASDTQSIRSLRSLEVDASHREPRNYNSQAGSSYVSEDMNDESMLIGESPTDTGLDNPALDIDEQKL